MREKLEKKYGMGSELQRNENRVLRDAQSKRREQASTGGLLDLTRRTTNVVNSLYRQSEVQSFEDF